MVQQKPIFKFVKKSNMAAVIMIIIAGYLEESTAILVLVFRPLPHPRSHLLNPSILNNSEAFKPFSKKKIVSCGINMPNFLLTYMLTFCLLSRSNFCICFHFLWVLGRQNQALDLQFCHLLLFDMPFM